MMTIWNTVSTRQLFSHPRVEVYEDIVELPNGDRTDYIHLGRGVDSAETIAINAEGLILLQKEYSYPPNKWLYQFPGGGMNHGESPTVSALRELAEEAGYTGDAECIGKFYINNRRQRSMMYVFLCLNLVEAKATKDIEEEFESHWMTEAEIDELIASDEVLPYSLLAGWAFYKLYKAHANGAQSN